jgi:hypothetical protein
MDFLQLKKEILNFRVIENKNKEFFFLLNLNLIVLKNKINFIYQVSFLYLPSTVGYNRIINSILFSGQSLKHSGLHCRIEDSRLEQDKDLSEVSCSTAVIKSIYSYQKNIMME